VIPALPPIGAALRWESLPPPWVLALVLLPAAVLLVALAYRREDLSPGKRAVLAGLRLATLAAAVLLLFGPFLEREIRRKVRSHVVVLLDTSASMAVADEPDPGNAAALSAATGIPATALGKTSRLDLARRALLEGGPDAPLERLRRKFVTHVYAFAGEPRTLWAEDEAREDRPASGLRDALGSLRADGASTRLGDSVLATLEDFRLRGQEEPLAGVVVLSDGRQTSGVRTPREAGEAARNFLPRGGAAARGVPVIAIVAGDPSSSRNVQVRNLVAPEVVLARDDASFEFDVVSKGFEGERAVLRLQFVDPALGNETLVPGEVVLRSGEAGERVRTRHRFDRPGIFRLKVGVPPLPGERVAEDNWIDHVVRVVDRKVRVLYVDGRPRREWESLQRALTRDSETMLVHTVNLESGASIPQPRTDAPGWPAMAGNRFPTTRQEIFGYDVIVLGDADWRRLADTPEEAQARLQDLRDFVEAGGGLLLIAGEFYQPLDYRRTALAELLPVIVDPDEVARTRTRGETDFNPRLTPEGRESPLFRIDEDPERSRALWETMVRWKQWWYFPARRAATGARVLAVHPRGGDGDGSVHGNRHGPHVLAAVKGFGLGRVLWIGMDELWRMRYGVGDQFYYAFYAKAMRYLAAYRLLGGNRRVKIHPERQVYHLDETVGITAHVVGEDFRPPSPIEKPKVAAILTLPDRSERTLDLLPVAQPEGEKPLGLYRATFPAVPAGAWTVAPDPAEVPGEEPDAKSFSVQASAEEQKDPSVDEEALRLLATASGGKVLALTEAREAADALKGRETTVPVEARPDPLAERWWIPVLLTCLLAAEWMLRKRWRLL
jgi:hypothetical protein